MATFQENWQTKCTSIKHRMKYIFKTALLSDVKFIVPVSNGVSESKVISAHKLVLATDSPVFFAMFYGQMADARDSIACLTVSMRVYWRYFVSSTAMKLN